MKTLRRFTHNPIDIQSVNGSLFLINMMTSVKMMMMMMVTMMTMMMMTMMMMMMVGNCKA